MDCKFSYRDSFFKSPEGQDEFITKVKLRFTTGESSVIKEKANGPVEYRKARHPLEYPNIGSSFKNIPYDLLPENLKEEFKDLIKTDPFPVIPVTKLINMVGLKGKTIGKAQFSEKQPNFIINLGGASSNDVKALINLAKQTIKEKYAIELEEEVMYLGGD